MTSRETKKIRMSSLLEKSTIQSEHPRLDEKGVAKNSELLCHDKQENDNYFETGTRLLAFVRIISSMIKVDLFCRINSFNLINS